MPRNNKNFKHHTRRDQQKNENEILIEWVYSQWKWDYGFVDVAGKEKGYFVFWRNNSGALNGDKVQARLKQFKGKDEAEVIKVLERKTDLIVWEFHLSKDKNFGHVISNTPNVKTDIYVPNGKTKNAKHWDIVWVQVLHWKGKNPEGKIVEIIGKKWDKKVDVNALIVAGWGRLYFSDSVIEYAQNIDHSLSKEEKAKRDDLEKLFTFTIDGADAKDLDDAISVKKLQNGEFQLYVHIADVAQYVTEKNPLDREAFKRATSIYLVDRVLPMLPEQLSNDLCSLNPNTHKLTLTCEMVINRTGRIKSSKVYESIINSNYRLTYKEVDQMLAGELQEGDTLMFWWTISEELISKLQIADELQKNITNYRQQNGVLNFDFPETKIVLDEDDHPVSIEEYPKYKSNKLIEEFMISANESVSKEFSRFPFLYRVHEEPLEDDMYELQNKLNLFGVKFQFRTGSTTEFSMLLNIVAKLEDESKKRFLEKVILRTLTKAQYSHLSLGHFGLGLQYYSHFTSPIRRYPDLQIHRIIKEKLHGKLKAGRVNHYETILPWVGNHTSEMERKADDLEYKIDDYYIVQYYKDKIWEEFEGVISGMLPKWFFVALPNTAEWFVELKKSVFHEEIGQQKDLKTGQSYTLWDDVRVKLIWVDELALKLNFAVVYTWKINE